MASSSGPSSAWERVSLVVAGAALGAGAAWWFGAKAARRRASERGSRPEPDAGVKDAAPASQQRQWSGDVSLPRWPAGKSLVREGSAPITPIAVVRSCYQQCHGVPRQPLLATRARAVIELTHPRLASSSVAQLEQFSHVWIIFVFHDLDATAYSKAKAAHEGTGNARFKTKVLAPRAGGGRVGVFATRTPHRPNPIGLSLARVDYVDPKTRRVYISGSDLVDGTPVLDVKPYLPGFDEAPSACVPAWVAARSPRRDVCFAPEVVRMVAAALAGGLGRLYADPAEFIGAVAESMAVDVSRRSRGKRCIFSFDGIAFVFALADGGPGSLPPPRELARSLPLPWYAPESLQADAAAAGEADVVGGEAAWRETGSLLHDGRGEENEFAAQCGGSRWLWLEDGNGGGPDTEPAGLVVGVYSACTLRSEHWRRGALEKGGGR